MNVYVAPIVEGQTEQSCVEQLLHRVWGKLLHRPERLQVLEPFRGHRDSLVHVNGVALADSVQKAFLKLQAKLRKDDQALALLLILLDAEGDCPAELAPRLLETARQARRDALISCVLAKRMLENWIVAGATSLAGVNGLPDPLEPPKNPEDRSGSFWLNEQLRSLGQARKYTKTADATVFVREMNLAECRAKSPSFDKLCRDLEALRPRPEPSS